MASIHGIPKPTAQLRIADCVVAHTRQGVNFGSRFLDMFRADAYSDAAIPREWYCKIPQTHNIRGFDRAITWRMKSLNSLYRVATLPMTDTQIDSIENKLLDLGIEGHEEAAQRYTNL